MSNYLKQSTAATIKLGPFVDETDGKTAETGLTISQADIRLSKNGGDFAQTNNAAGATHDENGYYDVPLDTTDTGTLGRLRVAVSESGALPVWQDFSIVTANVFDSLFSTDVLDVSVTQIAGSAVSTTTAQLGVNVVQISEDATAANNAEAFFDGTGYAGTNNVIPTVTTLTGHTPQTGDSYARLGAPAGASVSADMAAIKSDTGAILTDTGTDIPATLATIAGYIDTEVAAVLAAVDTEVAAILEDTGTTLDALIKDVPTVAEFEARTLAAASYFDPAADTVTVGANNDKTGYALADATSDAVIADAIWNALKATYGTAGTYGEHLEGLANSSDPSAATIAAQVRTELTTELARIDAAISTRLAGASYTAPDNASITAILEDTGATLPATLAGLATQVSVDDLPTNAELATALAGADDATLAAIAALNNVSSGDVQTAAAAALTAYDPPTKAELDSAVSPLATAAAVDAVDNYIDTEVAAIKAVTDKLDTTLVLDGAVYDFTAAALAAAPTGGSAPTASQIADAVWDEATSGHTTAGTTGKALTDAQSAGDPWSTAVPGAYAAGTAGYVLANVDTEVWASSTRTLTQAASSIAAIVAGTALTIQRGDTTTISLTGLGDISARTKLWFTVKDSTVDADTGSILFVEETGGLTVVNGAAYSTALHGAISVTDAVTGALTITINAAVTAQLAPDNPLKWDIQMLTASGVTTLTQGDARVTADITRATA